MRAQPFDSRRSADVVNTAIIQTHLVERRPQLVPHGFTTLIQYNATCPTGWGPFPSRAAQTLAVGTVADVGASSQGRTLRLALLLLSLLAASIAIVWLLISRRKATP